MANILPQIEHIVVVMLENRSLDNMCGWLYADAGAQPKLFLPAGSPAAYNGLRPELWNPSNSSFFTGAQPAQVPVARGTTASTVPNPDPEETFSNVTYQLFGPEAPSTSPRWPNLGFVVNYENATAGTATQIMQGYTPQQVPVISALARNFAISDAWYSSVPSQTWPNRAFVHAGTSNGNVDNGDPPDPLDWNVATIFNVLESANLSWRVYCDTVLVPSLTRTMFPTLWSPLLEIHFRGFDEFKEDCANNTLPRYSFIEPNFLSSPNDEHPPHDVMAGEQFLFDIWQAVSNSPGWNNTLLLITYDEHGGCYDHVMPPWGATAPDGASSPGNQGFPFNRFGVRVPMIAVSPYIQPGTVFRSDGAVPYDHTSVLATLRDWLAIPAAKMLPSKRIAAAPNLAQVLTLAAPGPKPVIALPARAAVATSLELPLNHLQMSIISGSARRFDLNPSAMLAQIKTRQDAVAFFKPRSARAHA
ncbi:MAG TPA: alkaline phosphatase family protein [Candidatus Angelobacter sp.]|nr:alkaline phosphatase family protein [Candidatus Angelobacter sp.]